MRKILLKVLDELNKDKPNLDYIRGMIEVIAEEEEAVPTGAAIPGNAIPVWGSDGTHSGWKAPQSTLNLDPVAQAEKEFNMMKNLPTI